MAWGRDDRNSDQVAYQGRVWQAYRGTNNEVKIKTVKFDGSDFRDFSVGGVTFFRPTSRPTTGTRSSVSARGAPTMASTTWPVPMASPGRRVGRTTAAS